MRQDDCVEMHLLIQADLDGELMPADSAGVAAHLSRCSACADLQMRLTMLAERIRQELTRHIPPSQLLAAVQKRTAVITAPLPLPKAANDDRAGEADRLFRLRVGMLTPFGSGFAVAACLALTLLLPRTDGLPDAVVAEHIRALQPGHLMDVVSTDQHTVKPWFDGRLDFAPPVTDLKAKGFPLTGGRLDYLTGKPVAALTYQRHGHVIDLFVWPDDGHVAYSPAEGTRSGYNYVRWTRNGMEFWAVSDLATADLAQFTELLQAN